MTYKKFAEQIAVAGTVLFAGTAMLVPFASFGMLVILAAVFFIQGSQFSKQNTK